MLLELVKGVKCGPPIPARQSLSRGDDAPAQLSTGKERVVLPGCHLELSFQLAQIPRRENRAYPLSLGVVELDVRARFAALLRNVQRESETRTPPLGVEVGSIARQQLPQAKFSTNVEQQLEAWVAVFVRGAKEFRNIGSFVTRSTGSMLLFELLFPRAAELGMPVLRHEHMVSGHATAFHEPPRDLRQRGHCDFQRPWARCRRRDGRGCRVSGQPRQVLSGARCNPSSDACHHIVGTYSVPKGIAGQEVLGEAAHEARSVCMLSRSAEVDTAWVRSECNLDTFAERECREDLPPPSPRPNRRQSRGLCVRDFPCSLDLRFHQFTLGVADRERHSDLHPPISTAATRIGVAKL